MTMLRATRRALLGLCLFLFSLGVAFAADIQVITSGAFAAALKELAPAFEKNSPHKVVISHGSSMGAAPDAIPARLARGERFDILIMAGPALDDFIRQGKAMPGSRVDLAASTIGAVVRAGAPRPDISTLEGFKNALLNAKSIAYSASASGTYLSGEVFAKIGVADQIKDKAKRIFSERVASVVARGDAELGFQQVSELLPVAGVDFIGEIPPEVQKVEYFSAGLINDTQNLQAARELIGFLASAAAAPVIKKTGMNPVVPKLPR